MVSKQARYVAPRLKVADIVRLLVEHQGCTKAEACERVGHAIHTRSLEIAVTLDSESREIATDLTAWHEIDWDSGIVMAELSSAGSPPLLQPVFPLFGRATVFEHFELELAQENTPALRRGGRPTQHDWDSFWVKICRRINQRGMPNTKKELVDEMLDWFEEHGDMSVDESTVTKKVSKLFSAMNEE